MDEKTNEQGNKAWNLGFVWGVGMGKNTVREKNTAI